MERSEESFDVQLSGCGVFDPSLSERQERESRSNEIATISGGNDGEVPPVPIPNTEVKLSSAESTWLDTAREDKSLPDSIILSSSMAEHSAVNRVVVGSSPTWGAIRSVIYGWSFCLSAFAFKLPIRTRGSI